LLQGHKDPLGKNKINKREDVKGYCNIPRILPTRKEYGVYFCTSPRSSSCHRNEEASLGLLAQKQSKHSSNLRYEQIFGLVFFISVPCFFVLRAISWVHFS
jgi:hypothetical protein